MRSSELMIPTDGHGLTTPPSGPDFRRIEHAESDDDAGLPLYLDIVIVTLRCRLTQRE